MFKKIIMYLLAIASFTIFAMERKEVALSQDYSNWQQVFDNYKLKSLQGSANYQNIYAYWLHEIKNHSRIEHASNPQELKKVLFLQLTQVIFKEKTDKNIAYFNDKNQLDDWLGIDKTEKESFGKAVCNASNYFYLIDDNKIKLFYDPFALWYMRIENLEKRKEYVKNNSAFLNMSALNVLASQKDFFNIKDCSVTDIRKRFLDPNSFFNNVMSVVCKNDIQLKNDFLSAFVKNFLETYLRNPQHDISNFIYSYCAFFNQIFKIMKDKDKEQDISNIVKQFPAQTEKLLDNFLLYDVNDIVSILLYDIKLQNVKTKEIRKKDALVWMENYASLKDDNDVKKILGMIMDHCIPSLIDLYEKDLDGLNKFLATIGDKDYQKDMQKEVINKLGKQNYEITGDKIIEKKEPKAAEKISEKPITIETQSKSLGLANMIQDSKKYPNPFDKVLSGYDNAFKNTYKKVLLYEGKSEEELSYNTSLKEILRITDEKLKRNEITYLEKKLLFAYFVDAIVKHPQESIKNISGLNQFLNDGTNGFDLKVKKELANILCVPKTKYYWFSDGKNIKIGSSSFAQKYMNMQEAERNTFIKNYIEFDKYDDIVKRFSDVNAFVNALNKLVLTQDQLKQFLTEYIGSFLAYNKNYFVFGYAAFFNELINRLSLNSTDTENLFGRLQDKDSTLLFDPYILQDPKDFLSYVPENTTNLDDLRKDIQIFINALKNNVQYKKQFDTLVFSENIAAKDLSFMVNKLVLFLYAKQDKDKLKNINELLKIIKYEFKKDSLYKAFFDAIQEVLNKSFQYATEYQTGSYGKDGFYTQFALKKNKLLLNVLENISKSEIENQDYYNKLYTNGEYQWDALFEELPSIISAFAGKDDSYFKKLLHEIIDQIVQKDINLPLALIPKIIACESLGEKHSFKLADYFCNKNKNLRMYAYLGEENRPVLKESPFAPVYREAELIDRLNGRQDDLLTFKIENVLNDKGRNDYKNLLYYMIHPNEFVKDILDFIPKDLKIKFLTIYIDQFNNSRQELFLPACVRFFNTIINGLDADITIKTDLAKRIDQNVIINDDKTKITIQDNADFLSTWLYITQDKNEKIQDSDRIAFINAIDAIQKANTTILKSMQIAFLQSQGLKRYMVRFLVPSNIENDAQLEHLNDFLKIVYNYNKNAKIKYNGDEVLREHIIKNEIQTILSLLDVVQPELTNKVTASIQKGASGNYYKLEFKKPEQAQKLEKPSIPIPVVQPSPELELKPTQNEKQPESQSKDNKQKSSVALISPKVSGQGGGQEIQEKNPSTSGNKIVELDDKQQAHQSNGGWTLWGGLKAIGSAIGSFFAWPFVKLWAWLNG